MKYIKKITVLFASGTEESDECSRTRRMYGQGQYDIGRSEQQAIAATTITGANDVP